ncbi:MAG: hypothetical protein HY332_04260 [Chloroflexi bacterium]|nr:hypothetical protein [Chloroflexota bacterium]
MVSAIHPGLVVTPGTPSGLAWDGEPLEVWGVRVASGAARDDWTDALAGQLDSYLRYGVNALTVFFQGSSGGSLQAFSSNGREIEPGVQRRMIRLVEAAAERRMIVVAGIFYHAQSWRLDPEKGNWLDGRAAYLRAAETATRGLRGYPNVIVNVANEYNVGGWQGCPFPVNTVEGVAELCRAAKQADPDRLVGGGGVHREGDPDGGNAALSLRPELDLLLFDWHGPSSTPVAAYRAGSTKPLMNVELFGGAAQGFVEEDDVPEPGRNTAWPGWGRNTPRTPSAGRRRIQGVFPPIGTEGPHRGKADFLAEIPSAAQTPGFSLFGHFPGWYQGPSRDPSFDNRFDLGGDGARQSPGIRWYFEAIARQRGLEVPSSRG